MKNLSIKRLTFTLSLLITLNSCLITSDMWGGSSRPGVGLAIKGFFIDKKTNRVVLVNHLNQNISHTNYSLPNTPNLITSLEIASKSSGVAIHFGDLSLEARGNKVYAKSIIVYINKKNLSASEINELRNIGFKDKNFSFSEDDLNPNFRTLEKPIKDFMLYMIANKGNILMKSFNIEPFITRYLSKKEKVKNFCLDDDKKEQDQDCVKVIEFFAAWQDAIRDKYTIKDHAKRILLTPFTLALDIITAPFLLLGYIAAGVGSN